MNKNIVIVGVGGSLGSALEKYFGDKKEFTVFGSTTKKEGLSKNIFFLDFLSDSSFTNFPEIKIDHLIICSGFEPKYNLRNLTIGHIEKMFAIHVTGPLLLIQKLQDKFSDESSITFISSVAAYQGSYDPSYATVKGAVNSLVRTLAKDLSPATRVNALAPSLIDDSTVFKGMTTDFRENHITRTLNKRLLKLNECCEAIEFIINAKHYTGQVLQLNGGTYYG